MVECSWVGYKVVSLIRARELDEVRETLWKRGPAKALAGNMFQPWCAELLKRQSEELHCE